MRAFCWALTLASRARHAGAGALAGKLGRFPAYLQGWVLFLAFVAGLTSYEFQIAQQLTSIRLILSNSKLGTPPGALGDVSSVSFGVAVPNVSQAKFQQGFFGIMIGFTVFHSAMNFLPAKRINQLAYTSFAWLCAISALIMFALPAARSFCKYWPAHAGLCGGADALPPAALLSCADYAQAQRRGLHLRELDSGNRAAALVPHGQQHGVDRAARTGAQPAGRRHQQRLDSDGGTADVSVPATGL